MAHMRQGVKEVKNDRIVWVKGSNGVEAPKWLSSIQHRVDLEILGDWKKGDKCFDDPNNKPKRTAASKKETKETGE